MNEYGRVPIKLYFTKTSGGPDVTAGYNLLTPALDVTIVTFA